MLGLLENRIPSLFCKIDNKSVNSKHHILFKDCFELEGMKDYLDNPAYYMELNQLLSSHHFTFYLDIDKVKSYIESINTMLQDSYDSEELLGDFNIVNVNVCKMLQA